jgi:hypothetical protein
MKLRAGDWVEVRSKEEILRTLDKKGRMENLPFMPQMFQYCGQRYQVYKRAHKTCDWVYKTKGRRLANGVHLELRCDGQAYGGCQSDCLIYWKEAWLKPVSETREPVALSSTGKSIGNDQSMNAPTCTEDDVWQATRANALEAAGEPRYVCQGTQVNEFTTFQPWWDVRQYVEDYTSRNVTFGRLIQGFIYASYTSLLRSGIGLGRPMRWLYDGFQKLWGGLPHPRRAGTIPVGQPTPTCILDLQPGELVRVKPLKEILATLNTKAENRGLGFDAEMVIFCGGTYRVRSRVSRYIEEKTGMIATMKHACITLEGVWCQAHYSDCRMFCPRSIYPWWHEIWLERVSESTPGSS